MPENGNGRDFPEGVGLTTIEFRRILSWPAARAEVPDTPDNPKLSDSGERREIMKRHWLVRVSPFLLLLILSTVALAADPPGRVARIQYVSGEVSVQPQGTGEWVQAVMNRPLTSSDNIWADKNSRAELNVGSAVFRIDKETSLTLVNVGDNAITLQLNQGALNLHIKKLYQGEVYEIRGPGLAFTVQKAGDFRFDVDPNGATKVTVWRGEGEVTGEGKSIRLEARQSAMFPNDTSLAHSINQNPRTDGFDDWCQVRDERIDKSLSAKYVSPEVIGSEDLDNNGHWENAPTYGSIWVPSVSPGWAPYRYGRWVWVDPWGWTWVDDAPWGFAPFHYGRWVYYNNYWAWAPGAYWGRPVYAPALVAWFGGSNWGASFGFGFGGVWGWCPLGWGEPFFPWFGVSNAFFFHVNHHVHNVFFASNTFFHGGHWGHWANSGHPGGFSAVNGHAIQSGLPVNSHLASVTANRMTGAPLGRNLSLQPTATSRLGFDGGRRGVAPPATVRGASSSGFGARGATASGTPMRANGPGPMRRGSEGSGFARGVGRAVPRPSTPVRSSFAGEMRGSGMGARAVPRPPVNTAMNSGVRMSGGSGYMERGSFRSSDGSIGATRGSSFGAGHGVPRPTGPVMRDSVRYSSSGSAGRQSYNGGTGVTRSYSYGARYGSGYSGGGASSGPRSYGAATGGSGGGHMSAPSGGVRSGGGSSGGAHSGGGHSSGGVSGGHSGGGSHR